MGSGFDVFLCTTNYDPVRAANAVRRMIENKVQGVAVMTSQLDQVLVEELLKSDIPVVLFDSSVPSKGRSILHIDYAQGSLEAVTHLRNQKHRKAGFITGPLSRVSAQRFKEALVTALRQVVISLALCVE